MDNTLLTEFFETFFDAIYVICYTGNKNRILPLKDELSRVGILLCNNFHWYYDVKSPYDEIMYKDIDIHYPAREKDNLYIKKIGMNHYKVSKISYDLGYKRILIMEDDVRFLNDLQLMLDILKKTPEDGDIILYDKMIWKIDKDTYKKIFNNQWFLDYSHYNLHSCAFSSAALYALPENGMKEIIENNEKYLTTPDTYTNYVPNLSTINICKRYVSNINVAIQNARVYFENHYKPFVNFKLYNLPDNDFSSNIH